MHPDWIALLESLVSHRVDFLVVGAAATAVHVQPRYTEDLDLWLRPTEANVEALRSSLVEMGFAVRRTALRDLWAKDRRKLTLGNAPSAVDLFNFQTGIAFDEAWERRLSLSLAGMPVAFPSLADLVSIKRAVGGYLNDFDMCLIKDIYGPQ